MLCMYVLHYMSTNKLSCLLLKRGPQISPKDSPLEFLDATTKTYTNNIESVWSRYMYPTFDWVFMVNVDIPLMDPMGFISHQLNMSVIFRPSTKGINFSTTIWPSSNSQGIKKTGFHMSLQSPKHQPLRRLHPLHILYRFISAITSSIIYNLLLHDVLHDPRGHLNCSEEEMPSHITTRPIFRAKV